VKCERFSQERKQEREIVSTDEGMQSDRSDGQYENAKQPRLETLLPGAKVRFKRLRQLLKQKSGMLSTDEGIQIDCSEE
jgi:hypothetical protein